jgi:plasmid stabilization system protein ParE
VDYKVIIAPRAVSDLRDIVLYASPDRPEAAKRLGYALIEKTKVLSSFPRSGGIVREFTDPNIRQLVLAPYRIIYRIDDTARIIGVARYWHGAQGDLARGALHENA